MTIISELPREALALLGTARVAGFDLMVYGVDAADQDNDPPQELLAGGVERGFLGRYVDRFREDPLRRMVARGEIPVTNLPVVFENDGRSLSLAKRSYLTSGDRSFLQWGLSQGMRTGVSFRIRLSPGRVASLNFYTPRALAVRDRDEAVEMLFLVGHRVHAFLEPKLARPLERLLSARETECLEWIALGKSNREIALLLGLSHETVKEYVQSLFQKLKVTGRAQAVSRGHALSYLN